MGDGIWLLSRGLVVADTTLDGSGKKKREQQEVIQLNCGKEW
jgi:hypothetical protein